MLYYDLGMLGILLFTMVRGAAKGIAWQLAAIAAMVLCFLFATPFSVVVEPVIRNHVESPLSRWIAMLAVYLAFSFGCFVVARMFRGFLEAIKFDAYDQHLGAMFGLLKGVILCFSISFFAVCLTSGPLQSALLNTNTGHISAVIMAKLDPILPREIEKVIHQFSRTLERKGNQILRDQGNENGNDTNSNDDIVVDDLSSPRGDRIDPGRVPGPFDDVDPEHVHHSPDRDNGAVAHDGTGFGLHDDAVHDLDPPAARPGKNRSNDEPAIAPWLRGAVKALESGGSPMTVDQLKAGTRKISDWFGKMLRVPEETAQPTRDDSTRDDDAPVVEEREADPFESQPRRLDRRRPQPSRPTQVDELPPHAVTGRSTTHRRDASDDELEFNDDSTEMDAAPAHRLSRHSTSNSHSRDWPEDDGEHADRPPTKSTEREPAWQPTGATARRSSGFRPRVSNAAAGEGDDVDHHTVISHMGVLPVVEPAVDQSALLQEIVAAYHSRGANADAFATEITGVLDLLPPAAAARVLRDWRADLYGDANDPDPETDIGTPLAERIRRQTRVRGTSASGQPEQTAERRSQPR